MINEYLKYWCNIEGVEKINEIFKKNDHEIRFIGGCVRDAFLGNKSKDIDFAVNCDPNKSIKILNENKIKFLEYGKKFGTITAVIGKNKFEITSLREDINQKGRHTDVIYTNDWYKDSLRRDFTFNAINIGIEGTVEDYFDGIKDINESRIKFIGNIEERIEQDYLRILRYFRFLGLFEKPNLIQKYEDSLYKNLSQLRIYVSQEQIRNEILKMMKNKFKMNSFVNLKNKNETNTLIQKIKTWWIEDQFDLGIKQCMNKIDELISINH